MQEGGAMRTTAKGAPGKRSMFRAKSSPYTHGMTSRTRKSRFPWPARSN